MKEAAVHSDVFTQASTGDYCWAFFCPPAAVVLQRDFGTDALINIGLCCLGWIPGIVRKFYHCEKKVALLTSATDAYYIVSHTGDMDEIV